MAYIKNIQGTSLTVRGRVVASNAYYLIPENERADWGADASVYDLVSQGKVLVSIDASGSTDIVDHAESWNYLNARGISQTQYVDSSGQVINLSGVVGAQGPQGIQGVQGAQGPAGPIQLVAKDTLVSTITLPNTTNFTQVRNFNFNLPIAGDCVLTGVISVKAHSTSKDMIFEWDLDGVTLMPNDTYREEFKDTSEDASNLRPIQFDLGNLSSGNHSLETYFRKEGKGGTAKIKYISFFIWRVS